MNEEKKRILIKKYRRELSEKPDTIERTITEEERDEMDFDRIMEVMNEMIRERGR